MKSREFEEKKFREMEEEQIYANRDHELMLAEKRKKDQEYFRHNLEKQIEERRGRLTGRESSKSIDSDFVSCCYFPFPFSMFLFGCLPRFISSSVFL